MAIIVIICIIALVAMTIKMKKRMKKYENTAMLINSSSGAGENPNGQISVINNSLSENEYDNRRSLIDNQLL
jgi:uncharacterized membrane protein YqiK